MATNTAPKAIFEAMSSKPLGYHRLADIMSKDACFTIFRRFNDINILNLLSLQAEILNLRNHFKLECGLDDLSDDVARREYSKYFLRLHQSQGKDSQQYQMLLEMREKMNEYNTLLLQAYATNKIARPKKAHLAQLINWLQDAKGGDCFQKGAEARLWDEDEDASVYLTLWSPVAESNIFRNWVRGLVVNVFHHTWGEKYKLGKIVDEESGLVSYDDSKVNTASTVFVTVVSSILPVVTILVLYIVKSTIQRICITVAFTAVFASVLAVCTSARSVEIFAATASFAAVEVVFIGSTSTQ